MQQRYRSKFHKHLFYCSETAAPISCDFNRLVSMLGVAGEQIESVRQQRQDGAEAVLSARRAAREVNDEHVARDATNAAAKGCKWSLLNAAEADLLRDTRNETITDRECGFGSHVALRQASATCS